MKLLLGYDGSECADAAIDDLLQAGLPDTGELHVLSVAEVWLPPPPPSTYEVIEEARDAKSPADLQREFFRHSEAAKEALALAVRAEARLQVNLPNWKITTDALCGSPAWELVAKADEWRPDLIVVGSHGRTALGRFFLGSVSQRVLNEAHCSVRIARGRVDEPKSPVRILAGVDGSPISREALRVLANRSWTAGSEVKVVLVNDPLLPEYLGKIIPPVGKWLEEDRQEERAWLERVTKESLDILSSAGIKASCAVREGDPKQELLKAAEDWRADCIFLGSVGFSNKLERFVLGSVSSAIAARAHCSVEIVRKQVEASSTKETPR